MIIPMLICGNFLVLIMSLTWLLSVRLNNAGIVDVVWAASFTPVIWMEAAMANGGRFREILLVGMITFWSLRLAGYLFVRVKSHHPVEDARYATMRQRWGSRANWNMFTFFQFQGLLILILSFPFFLILRNPQESLNMIEWGGAILWLIAFSGESMADAQLKTFKSNPANKGKVCQVGLWRYSRHPNYFFEWMIWVSFALFAMGSPWGWIAWYSPLLMLFFLLRVTGIPATEEQALKSKGEAYRAYQKSTPSAFVPWFRAREL